MGESTEGVKFERTLTRETVISPVVFYGRGDERRTVTARLLSGEDTAWCKLTVKASLGDYEVAVFKTPCSFDGDQDEKLEEELLELEEYALYKLRELIDPDSVRYAPGLAGFGENIQLLFAAHYGHHKKEER